MKKADILLKKNIKLSTLKAHIFTRNLLFAIEAEILLYTNIKLSTLRDHIFASKFLCGKGLVRRAISCVISGAICMQIADAIWCIYGDEMTRGQNDQGTK
jgi:hypothetical protein